MIKDKENKKRVVVAMSGGVDSSVSAVLLKKEGFDVIGVFMKFWKDGKSGINRCCSSDSEKNARLICKKLNIPFYVFNFEKEFKKRVVDYFLDTIKKGLTPNPCVVCNKEIKFGLLLEKSLKLEADYLATGHYARKKETKSKDNKIFYKLLKGKDKKKDQSYFLWRLNQKRLKHILFPVGNYNKEEVRKLAKKFKLPVYNAPESMEVCFIPKTINNFLEKHIKNKKGDIICDNKKIGSHNGLWFYTIGQRKGIGLSNGPYYVIKKDIKKNILYVSKDEKDLLISKITIKDINFISKEKIKFPLSMSAKARYNQKEFKTTVNKDKMVFNKPQKAITPGQSMVFYKGEEVLGGGTIE